MKHIHILLLLACISAGVYAAADDASDASIVATYRLEMQDILRDTQGDTMARQSRLGLLRQDVFLAADQSQTQGEYDRLMQFAREIQGHPSMRTARRTWQLSVLDAPEQSMQMPARQRPKKETDDVNNKENHLQGI